MLSPEACLEEGVDRPKNDINIPRNNKIYIYIYRKKEKKSSPFLYPLTIKGCSVKIKI